MQTFLCFPNYQASARHLDNKRLNKQITECWQILQAVREPGYGWQHHPAVNMWRDYENSLLHYGVACYYEWRERWYNSKRGGKLHHKSGEFLHGEFVSALVDPSSKFTVPPWLTEEFCSNHRSILLGKNYEHYSQFGWDEKPAEQVNGKWPYLWPTEA